MSQGAAADGPKNPSQAPAPPARNTLVEMSRTITVFRFARIRCITGFF